MAERATRLHRLVRSLDLTAEDLDEMVHDLAQAAKLGELNALGESRKQEQHISEVEQAASRVNNGGLDSQLAFFLSQISEKELTNNLRQLAKEKRDAKK